MDQRGCLQRGAMAFTSQISAGEEAQLGIDLLPQPRQGSFVTAAPGFQQIRDFGGACVDC